MTDLEMTKLCAEATGWGSLGSPMIIRNGEVICAPGSSAEFSYDPLYDDAQAMALVKKLHLQISYYNSNPTEWRCVSQNGMDQVHDPDLNRAICECVAKMQAAK